MEEYKLSPERADELIRARQTADATQAANESLVYMNIKGKDYATVSERVRAFRCIYPNGAITTQILSQSETDVTIKASVYDERGNVIATGHATENKNASNINRNGGMLMNCVPLDTQILTRRGWLYFYQIRKGKDEALSLNLDTKKVEYSTIENYVTYKDASVYELKTGRFKAVCTGEHKWITDTSRTEGKFEKTETVNLNTNHRIITNVPQDITPSDEGRRLGWLICDCEITRTKNGLPSSAYINQSKQANVDEICRLFPEYPAREQKRFSDKWLTNYEWDVPAERVREILGKYNIATYEDLPRAMCEAPVEDVAGCFESMMKADGSRGRFSSTYRPLVEAVQIACARLGISTTFITSRMMKGSTRPLFELGIRKTTRSWFSMFNVRSLPPCDVWCPNIKNGTWFMKQGSFVCLTSNCETSAVGRALGFLGIGTKNGIATADEVDRADKIKEETNALHICRRCGRPIIDTQDTAGKIWTADEIAKYTLSQAGDCYCLFCLAEIAKAGDKFNKGAKT